MKARIKKTGEIVNISEYARITLDQCNSWGNPIEVRPEDIELIQETTEDEHWQNVRERAAIAAMQGVITILGSSDGSKFTDIVAEGFTGSKKSYPNEIAEFSVACANALIEELKKK